MQSRFLPSGRKRPAPVRNLIGPATLIPLFGSQVMILFFALYFLSPGETRNALITLFVGYPLLSVWIDFYLPAGDDGKTGCNPPVMMMIGILAGVPFMGIVVFIVGPVLVALAVTGYKILAEEGRNPASRPHQD